MKLNLGCGDKILPGWTNVDTSTARGKPDVEADIRDLPFDDNVADEAMAIHVIEHFYVWEVEALLKEWIRVLKPGGKLILECPDLDKVVRHYMTGNGTPQLFWWPLYGDPGHCDPLMIHKWGYTPGTLSNVLNLVGLKDIQQEPAEYKLKDYRDMRIVGYK